MPVLAPMSTEGTERYLRVLPAERLETSGLAAADAAAAL